MQIGNGVWVAGWTSFSLLLAFVASLVGPGLSTAERSGGDGSDLPGRS